MCGWGGLVLRLLRLGLKSAGRPAAPLLYRRPGCRRALPEPPAGTPGAERSERARPHLLLHHLSWRRCRARPALPAMTDAATDALIAKLCAEENNPYYDSYYGAFSDEELSEQDSDYGSAKKKKPKGGKRGASRVARSPDLARPRARGVAPGGPAAQRSSRLSGARAGAAARSMRLLRDHAACARAPRWLLRRAAAPAAHRLARSSRSRSRQQAQGGQVIGIGAAVGRETRRRRSGRRGRGGGRSRQQGERRWRHPRAPRRGGADRDGQAQAQGCR